MSTLLEAGIGRADITPPPHMPGGIWKTQKHIRAEGIHRALYVTALLLAQDEEVVLILSFDLCFLTSPQEAAISEAVCGATGLPSERVWLFTTHTHAPPLTQEAYAGEGEDEVRAYTAALPAHAASAARAALADRGLARIGSGRSECRIGANRNWRTADGRTIVAPNPAGVFDPEVGVLRLDRCDDTPLACVAVYGCHPHVLGPDNRLISPDYPGVMRDFVERETGATCLFLQGCGGNVCPRESFVAELAVVERLGRILGCAVTGTFLEIDTEQATPVLDHVIESAAPLGVMRREPAPVERTRMALQAATVSLPARAGLAARREQLAAEREQWRQRVAQLEVNGEAGALNTARIACMRVSTQLGAVEQVLADGGVPVQLRLLALGDIALVGIEAEAFAEVGLAIKRASPYAQTLVAGYLGKNGHYLGPASYYSERPGYEIEYSPFAPEAAQELIDRALASLAGLSAEALVLST